MKRGFLLTALLVALLLITGCNKTTTVKKGVVSGLVHLDGEI